MMLSFVLVVVFDCALLPCIYLYNTGGSVWPSSQIFHLSNIINLCLFIRRSELVELPSHLIILLPSRPPKVDSKLTLLAW